jgi:Zn-dependent peptidase ImmA (M78 family)
MIDIEKVREGLENNRNGYCVYEKQEIYIASGQSPERTRRFIIHELTHAVHYSFGLHNMKHIEDCETISQFNEFYLDTIYALANEVIA